MTARKPFTLIAAILLLIVAVLHLYRLFSGIEIMVGNHVVPQSASWVALVIMGVLGIMLLVEARK